MKYEYQCDRCGVQVRDAAERYFVEVRALNKYSFKFAIEKYEEGQKYYKVRESYRAHYEGLKWNNPFSEPYSLSHTIDEYMREHHWGEYLDGHWGFEKYPEKPEQEDHMYDARNLLCPTCHADGKGNIKAIKETSNDDE